MFAVSPVYWGVLIAVLVLSRVAESNSTPIKRKDGTIWHKPNKSVVILLASILTLVAGFRYMVGTDFPIYYRWPIPQWSLVFHNLIYFHEGGFSLIQRVATLGSYNPQNVIFLCSVITVGLYCRTIYKYSSSYALAMILYLLMGEWQGSFNAIRQYLAAAVLFSGHRLILERRLKDYLLLIFIAALFHKTAVVMTIPYFLFTRKPNQSQIALLLIGALVIRFSYGVLFDAIGDFMGSEQDVEGDEYRSNSINPLRILVAFFPTGVYILQCVKDNLTKEQIFYINAAIFHSFSMLSASGSCYLGRVGVYTAATTIIGYGVLFQLIKDENNRRTTTYIIVALFLIYWLYSVRMVSYGNFMFNFNVRFF